MRLGDICNAPCFAHAAGFQIPGPGCSREDLEFGHEQGRRFYAVLLENHLLNEAANPRVAIVGLSPAGNQIDDFLKIYQRGTSYQNASARAAFADLVEPIISMLDGLGISKRLQLNFPRRDTFAGHPDILATSLLACATLDSDYSSDDFDLTANTCARKCATERFLRRITNPKLDRLTHVLILGAKGRQAVKALKAQNGKTILETLVEGRKTVLYLPHPSGQNAEYVKLASLPQSAFPSLDEYTEEAWLEYRLKSPRISHGKQRPKQTEAEHKSKRTAAWSAIERLRREVAGAGES